MSKDLIDLSQSKAFIMGRSIINGCRNNFSGVPFLRDFIPERVIGLLFKPRVGRFAVPTLWGPSIVVEPSEGGIVENMLYRFGSYETGMCRLLDCFVRKGDSVIDAGANVGAFTVPASVAVGSEGCVHSFEPVGTTAELLKQTIELGNLKNVTLYQVALGSSEGTAPMYGSKGEVNRGGNSLCPEGHEGMVEAVVPLRRLDKIISLEEWKKVKVMKVDVEEWELEVFQGALNLLKSGHLPVLIVEYFHNRGEKAHKLYEFLKSLPNSGIYKMRYSKRAEGPLVPVKEESELNAFDNFVVLPDGMRSLIKIVR